MRLSDEIRYFDATFLNHVQHYLSSEAIAWCRKHPIRYGPLHELDPTRPGLFVPIDVPLTHDFGRVRRLPYNGTQLTVWETLPPLGDQWAPWPTPDRPLGYCSANGAMVLSWNVFALCMYLLKLGEEEDGPRDEMLRSVAASSPRARAGLLDVPAVNEAFAALALVLGVVVTGQEPEAAVSRMAPRLEVCLSHDLDQLRGNDRWTQAVRAFRLVEQAKAASLPDGRALWWIARNQVRPWTYYLGNVIGMLELEAMLGFRSTLYFLNGAGGRFGARSGDAAIKRLLTEIPPALRENVDFGVHYNFDTLDDPRALDAQIAQLSGLIGERPAAGRAHYLRYSGPRSSATWVSSGIRVDETFGYPDAVGFRSGIAGPYLLHMEGAPPLIESPLAVMDGPLLAGTDRSAAVDRFAGLLDHVGRVGGLLSLLFHPGVFDNPEYANARFVYRLLLESARRAGAQSVTSADVLGRAGDSSRLF